MALVAHLDHSFGARPIARGLDGRARGRRDPAAGDLVTDMAEVDVRAEIEMLFTRHHGEIYAYLARMCREPELAADLAQDTFVKAYKAYDSLEDPAHARAWLYQIAHRVALDEFRRRKIVRFLPWTGESRGAAPSAEHLALEGRFSGDMERALARMPERQRSALLLAELHDLTGLELAAALGVSHVAARALLTRARESLRQALAAEREADAAADRERTTAADRGATGRDS
jgi:RNA polymerase sigma-70 factor (ECF subfamily)